MRMRTRKNQQHNKKKRMKKKKKDIPSLISVLVRIITTTLIFIPTTTIIGEESNQGIRTMAITEGHSFLVLCENIVIRRHIDRIAQTDS
jgi:hypothetical protein